MYNCITNTQTLSQICFLIVMDAFVTQIYAYVRNLLIIIYAIILFHVVHLGFLCVHIFELGCLR